MVNPVIRFILRSPLHKAVSSSLMLLTFYGRNSGRRYSVPVGYAQADGQTLLVGTESRWWKNLQDGARVEVRLRGERLTGSSEVISDEAGMQKAYQDMLSLAPRYGQAIGVSLGSDGRPRLVDVARVKGEGHVVIRIRLDWDAYAATGAEGEAGEEVAPGVVRIPLRIVNAFLVGDPGGPWVLVDAGTPGSAEKIRAVAERRFGAGARPEAIILTHGHGDHTGSAAALSDLWDVPIYAHRLELPFLTGLSAYPPSDPTVGGPFAFLSRFMPNRTVADLGERVHELPPDCEVPGIEGWRSVHTPGHTPGHVALFRPEDRVLLAGDALATMDADSFSGMLSRKQKISRPAAPVTPDWDAAERSVKEMATLRARVLAPGHGEPMAGPTVAEELAKFAERFLVPERGRYIGEPARFNELGVAWLPPAPPDPLPKAAAVVSIMLLLGTAAATWLAVARRRRQRA
jgi:deazaflavin-dependent oxidoreductase (nitroreductase family)